ncbi:MAG: isochorismate synthase [Actinobacteria bacterium]|nr:isochorismate synthase [Actinomycetota bacterium]
MNDPRARAAGLVARTVELDGAPAVDLLAVAGPSGFLFEREGHGVAGQGVALRVDVANMAHAGVVAEALAGIAVEDEVGLPGTGAVAVGALPFDPESPGSMVVPALLVGRSPGGRQWLTTVQTRSGDVRAALGCADIPRTEWEAPELETMVLPDGFTLTSPRSHADWEATVCRAVEAIAAGDLEKVVVAREVVVECNRPIVVPDVVDRLRTLYPSCTVFSVDGFVGASPELLVERRGADVRCHPLAGTYPRSGDPSVDRQLAGQLLASAKERREHRYAVEQISEALRPACVELAVPESPSVLPLRNVVHLGTDIRGRLAEPAPTALELAALLHPTPAVGGTPTKLALDWLAEHEGLDRGRYAGPVGWVDGRGDGSYALGIRSAEVSGARARLFAGVGIVEGSDPRRELIETQLKLQALLAALVRP